MVTEIGQYQLRAENVDSMIKDLAERLFVMKQIVDTSSSSSWKETYWRETTAVLSVQGNAAIRGVPRLAALPELTGSWTRQTVYNEKYGGTKTIAIEDILTDEIDVMSRAIAKISEAIANTVDTQIWNVITESQSASSINTVTIASGNEWNSATVANRMPHQDILAAIREIAIDNINPYSEQVFLVVNPTDFANIMGNSALISHPSWKGSSDILNNGKVGTIFGIQILVTNVVTADYAGVFVRGLATWKEVAPLTTSIDEKAGVSRTISAWGIGVCALHTPNKSVLISNTRA